MVLREAQQLERLLEGACSSTARSWQQLAGNENPYTGRWVSRHCHAPQPSPRLDLKLQAGGWRTWRHPCAQEVWLMKGLHGDARNKVTQCHHLTQHHRGMVLLSKLDISPGFGATVTFPPLLFLGQIWYKEVSSCPAALRQPGVLEQRGFSGRTVPFGPPGTIHLLAGLLHKYLSRQVCASTLPPTPLPGAHR